MEIQNVHWKHVDPVTSRAFQLIFNYHYVIFLFVLQNKGIRLFPACSYYFICYPKFNPSQYFVM